MKSFPFKDFHKSRLKLEVAFFSQSVLNQFPKVLLPLEKQDREECFETSRGQTLKHKISLKLELLFLKVQMVLCVGFRLIRTLVVPESLSIFTSFLFGFGDSRVSRLMLMARNHSPQTVLPLRTLLP